MFTPNTVIKLLENVNLSIDYKNTFSFASASAQASFFIGKTKLTLDNFTYQRKERMLKVGVNIESLFNVSYLMFQNSNYGTKWFYAFITDMQYINEQTTAIMFEIDVLQTWLFDVELKNCFVEREHVADDTIGVNQIDENLSTGDYITVGSARISELDDLAIVVSSTVDSTGEDVTGELYTGIYSGNALYASSDFEFVNSFITALSSYGKADAINNIFLMPSALIDNFEDPIRVSAPLAKKLNISVAKNITSIDGYTPKNKKVLCYPYNYLMVGDNKGNTSIYKYELSGTSTMDFFVSCDVNANPTVYLVPKNYKGLIENFDEFMTLTGFPLCSWTTDIYKNWCAQNAASNAVGIGGSALSLVAGVATANPIAIGAGVLGVASSIGNFYEKSLQPNPIKGSVTGGGSVALGVQNFTFYQKTIRAEFAKIIDSYFDMYGYKVNQVKTPNVKTRTNWNFIKLIESNIFGNIPNKDKEKINEIYKNGLTFWHNDNVGNYNRVNATV